MTTTAFNMDLNVPCIEIVDQPKQDTHNDEISVFEANIDFLLFADRA